MHSILTPGTGISWDARDIGSDGSLFGRDYYVSTSVYQRCGTQRVLQDVRLAGGGGRFSNWLNDLAHLPASNSNKFHLAICGHSKIFSRERWSFDKS